MTTIAGFVGPKGVALGSDSAVSSSTQWTQPGCKILLLDIKTTEGDSRMAVGTSGSIRFVNLLRYDLRPPIDETDDAERYLVSSFGAELRRTLTDARSIDSKDGRDEADSYALVAYRSRLFRLGFDFSVSEPSCGYAAIGSGGSIALGAMHALTAAGRTDPELVVRAALDASAEMDPYTNGPLSVVTVR